MVKLYTYLISAGLKTIDDVPGTWKSAVILELQKAQEIID